MSQFFASGGQSIVSASASVLSMNIQGWFPLQLTGFISLQSKGLSRAFSNSSEASILQHSAFFIVQLSHPYMNWKNHRLTIWTYVNKVMSLLFIMASRFVKDFLPRSKHHLISRLQSPSAVILEPPINKFCHCFHYFPIYLSWSDGTGCHDLSFLNVEPTLSLSSFTFIKRLFSFSSLSAIRVVSSAYLRLLIFLPAIFDSSLCFIQPSVSHDVLCICVK